MACNNSPQQPCNVCRGGVELVADQLMSDMEIMENVAKVIDSDVKNIIKHAIDWKNQVISLTECFNAEQAKCVGLAKDLAEEKSKRQAAEAALAQTMEAKLEQKMKRKFEEMLGTDSTGETIKKERNN